MAGLDLLLIHGDDPYQIDAELAAWRQRATSAQLGVETVESGASPEKIRAILADTPLLDPQRFVLLNEPVSTSRKGSDTKGVAEALQFCAPTTAVCMVMRQKLPDSNALLSAVKSHGGAIKIALRPKGRQLRLWTEEQARKRKLKLPARAIDYLISTVGENPGAIASELEKLEAYAGEKPISLSELETIVAGEGSAAAWQVVEQLLGSVPGQGAATLNSLIDEGRPTQLLLITIAGQLRDLLNVKNALQAAGGTAAGVAAHLRIPEWKAERMIRQAGAVSREQLQQWLAALQLADAKSKTGDADDQAGLRYFGLSAAAAMQSRR